MPCIRFLTIALLLFTGIAYSQNCQQLLNEGKDLRSEGKDVKAIKKLEEALDAAEAENNIQVQMNAHLELAELKDNVVNYKEALDHYEAFSALYKGQAAEKTRMLEDSVSGLQTEVATQNTVLKKQESEIDSLTTEQLQSQLEIKDLEIANHAKALEIKASENRRNLLLFVLAIVVLGALFVVRGYVLKRRGVRTLRQKNYEINMAKQKSDELLLNILPETIADELKEFGRTTPFRHDHATVMFTDFKGFTKFSEKHSPEELVKLVDHYFRAFDQIVSKYHIEKIKTIGDAYMCVCGIPQTTENHASNMIRAAFEFHEFVNHTAEEKQKQNLPYLQMRVGIHSGPLVAGVVGSRKFAYDVWGDTVNIAARMEQSGEPGSINVSESVYELVSHEFDFNYRGEVEAKNKGLMKMYFVTGTKEAARIVGPDTIASAKKISI